MKRCVDALFAAGLAFACLAPAHAGNVSISNARTTPVNTSTADGTSAGDVTITSSGSVTVTTGPAVTLDSSNAVNNQGTIAVTSDTGAVGVLVEAGNTGSLTSSGTINALITDSSSIATGSGNVAIWVSGSGAFLGNISLASGSTTKVGGTNSFGLRLDSDVQGTIDIAGAMTADGTGTTGLQANGLITGNVTVESGASILTTGDGARVLVLAGGVDGAFKNAGSLSADGAQANVTYSGTAPAAAYSVGVGASITGGFQNTGAISAISAAEGVLISPTVGTSLSNITLGVVDVTDIPYGFENEGSISASTVRTGEDVAGVLIAGTTSGPNTYSVTIDGGIKNTGSIGASRTADGTATGLKLGNFVSAPALVNTGTISATAGGTTTTAAYGLLLEAGANIASLDNSGTISASASSIDTTGKAIVDLSGTLLSLTNSGTITGSAATTDTTSGTASAVAIDLSNAQGGITLTDSGNITGAVLLGDHNDTVALIADGDSDATTTSTWTGSIDFGGGDDTFTISGAGVFTGGIASSGTLAITVNDGVMAIGSTDTVAATTIDFTSASKLSLVINPDIATTPRLTATDKITFESGAIINATLEDFVGQNFTAVLARAPTIDGSISSSDLVFENLPYLYAADAQIMNGVEQELDLVFQLKTAAALGFNANQTAFYNSVIDILSVTDNALATPLLSLSDGAEFTKAYNLLMPSTAQPALRANMIVNDDIERSIHDRAGLFAMGDKSFDDINAWFAGSGRAYSVNADALSRGIDGSIVSTTFGVDRMFIPWAMIGAELTFSGADMNDAGSKINVLQVDGVQGGVYAALSAGPLYVSGSVGAGSTSNHGSRTDKLGDASYVMSDAWHATFTDAAAEAGLYAAYMNLSVRPWVGLSYLSISEPAHHEDGAGTGFDLAYDAIDADIERAKAGLTIAYTYSHPEVQFTPELRAAWSQLLNDVPSELHGSFVDGSVPFILTEAPIAHDEYSAGLGFTLHGKGLAVSLGYDATFADGSTSHAGKLEISTQF